MREKTFETIAKLKDIELELLRLRNALDMANKALDAQSAQEPVAWMNKHGDCKSAVSREAEAGAKEEYNIPLYTNQTLEKNT